MAQINRYSRPAQVAKFDPMSAEEMMAVPLMKQQMEDQQMTDQRALLKDLYNVQGVQGDQARVNAKKDELANRLQEIATDITTNGVSAKKTQAFNALKGEYDKEMSLTGELGQAGSYAAKQKVAKKNFYTAPGHKNWSKAQLDAAWEIDAAKRSAFNGDEFVQEYEEYGLTSSPTLTHLTGVLAKDRGSSTVYDKAGNAINTDSGQLQVLEAQLWESLTEEGSEANRIMIQSGLDPNNPDDVKKAREEIRYKILQLAKTKGGKRASTVSKKATGSEIDTGSLINMENIDQTGFNLGKDKEERDQQIKDLDKEIENSAPEQVEGLKQERARLIHVTDLLTEEAMEKPSGIALIKNKEKAKLLVDAAGKTLEDQKKSSIYWNYVDGLEKRSTDALQKELYTYWEGAKDATSGPLRDRRRAITLDRTWAHNRKMTDVDNEEARRSKYKKNLAKWHAEDMGADVKKMYDKTKIAQDQIDNYVDGRIGGNNAHYQTNMISFANPKDATTRKAYEAWTKDIKGALYKGLEGFTVTKGVYTSGDNMGDPVEELQDEQELRQLIIENIEKGNVMGVSPANAYQDPTIKVMLTKYKKVAGKEPVPTTMIIDVAITGGQNTTADNIISNIFGNRTVEGDQFVRSSRDNRVYKHIVPTIGNKIEDEGAYASSDEIVKLLGSSEGIGSKLAAGKKAFDIFRNPTNDKFSFKYKGEDDREETLTYGELLKGLPLSNKNVKEVNAWSNSNPHVVGALINEIKQTEGWDKFVAAEDQTKEEAVLKKERLMFLLNEMRSLGIERATEPLEFFSHFNVMKVLM